MASIDRFYQRAKNGVHAIQALIVFVGAATTIAVYTKGGSSDGRINYYFVLCWFCIPALVYQTAFPIFERTKRFANPYAHAAIDAIYAILWFAAFVGIFVWVRQGSHAAKGWDSSKDKLCDKFADGPTSKCKLGQSTGAIGVIICLLFVLTTAFSIYGIRYYRLHGSLPTTTASKTPEPLPTDDDQEDDYAFSSNPHDKLDQQQEMQPMHHRSNSNSGFPDEISSLHTDPEELAPHHQDNNNNAPTNFPWERHQTPDLPMGDNFYPVDTSYHGSSSGGGHTPTPYDPPQPPPHHQRMSDSYRGKSPSHLYDTMHSHESNFVGGIGAAKPRPTHSGAGDPFRDELALSHGRDGDGRIDFPDADYGRLGR